ncbi:anti-sigma factor [Mycolicibacterium moriokaense]|uniref:Anti-sigma factor n=1 Tax=Mycolicibacterium moriokaense TaxID=39691 RepID=A0AAD1M9A6_9MYCO|nr:zf-HC2 domain-containing protein [Mycolicibacterium moriokaense]MCV7041370.1 zf-HC2 domain-containing protein [Mycolicibacterium moriokaense]ORB19398.1 anti-sigma factor [Mycolicibacterium moriokaense]BBX04426.1 anti-sigma factor [Mycolicibacterium moriokaense]
MTRLGLAQGGEGLNDDRYATWDAAYVLGSLTEEDRREYEAHLPTCARCRAAVAELSDIPPLLATLDTADVAAIDGEQSQPPPHMLDSLLTRVQAQRRRSRWMTTAALAVAAAVVAIALVVGIRPQSFGLQQSDDQPAAAAMEMTKVSDTPINATISMTGYGWGTRIDMACTYGDWGRRDAPPQNLGMVVVGRDGSQSQVATWLGLSGATALPSGNTPLPMDQIAAVQLVSPDSGQVLLEKKL